jgi:hypothetical protein
VYVLLVGFQNKNKNLNFLDRVSKNPHIKFHEKLSSGSLGVPCEQTDNTKIIVAFLNFWKSAQKIESFNHFEVYSNLFRVLIGTSNLFFLLNSDKGNPCTGLLQGQVEAPGFIDNRYMKVVFSS